MPRRVEISFKRPRGGYHHGGAFDPTVTGGAYSAGIHRAFVDMKHGWLRNRRDLMDFIADLWIDVVLGTAWHGPPAPISSIIADRQGNDRVRIGWHDYPSGTAKARQRYDKRKEIFSKVLSKVQSDPRYFRLGLGGSADHRRLLDQARAQWSITAGGSGMTDEDREQKHGWDQIMASFGAKY